MSYRVFVELASGRPDVAPSLNVTHMMGWFVGVPARVAATIIGALVARWLLHRAIRKSVALAIAQRDRRVQGGRADRVLTQATGMARERHRQRMHTLGTMLRSVVTLIVTFVALLTVMALLGIPLGPLLASAGVGGVALGLGAQSLVKDFLSGIFMILEDQYGVGDHVDLGDAVGIVEDVSLRVTAVRDGDGVLWFVRNGEIARVANRSQGGPRAPQSPTV